MALTRGHFPALAVFLLSMSVTYGKKWENLTLWQSASGLPILSGQCQPIPSCSSSGMSLTTPASLAGKLYSMLGNCTGLYGLTQERCDNFVTLSVATLQKDATGSYCLTSEILAHISELAAAILPDFPMRKPLKNVADPSLSTVPTNTVPLSLPTSARTSNVSLPDGTDRFAINYALDAAIVQDMITFWRDYSWNGYRVTQCAKFPSYLAGTVAYTKCAGIICSEYESRLNDRSLRSRKT